MSDSDINPRSGDGAQSDAVTYRLETVRGQQAVVMQLSSAWLHSPGRVYPVTADPSVSAYNASGSTYVRSDESGDFSGDVEIRAGTWNGGGEVAKSFIQFNLSSLKYDTVLGAGLDLFNSWSYSCQKRLLDVYPVTQSWTVSGSKSWPGPSTGASIGSANFASGWVPLGSTVSPCPARWVQIPLSQAGTSLIDGWTQGTTPNYGLAIGASATDSYAWKKFTSFNNPTGDPFLTVTYTTYGAAYKLASTRPVTQVTPEQNGKIKIQVTNEGSVTWPANGGYELSYEAYNAKGQEVASHPVFTPFTSAVAPQGSATVTATVDELPAGYYVLDWDMYANATGSSPTSFLSQDIPVYPMGLYVDQPVTTVSSVYPPTGYVSPTNTPQLRVTASTNGGGTPQYDFSMTCEPLPGTTCPSDTVGSGYITSNYWTPPALAWNEPYAWQVTVETGSGSTTTYTTTSGMTMTPEVPQPAVMSRLGQQSGQSYRPGERRLHHVGNRRGRRGGRAAAGDRAELQQP